MDRVSVLVECATDLMETALRRGMETPVSWILYLDIIFYESAIHSSDFIQIPHPEMQKRAFVLKPLLDLIPHFEHPILKQTITQLWEKCPDQLEVGLFVE